MAPKDKPQFRVEAVLPAPARTYFLERDSAAFRSLLSKMLKIGQLTFVDLWHEGSSSFVRMVTKPEFGSWVPKGVAGQLQSSNLEFHDIIEYRPCEIAEPPYRVFVRTESPFLKDKLDIQLTLTIEELEGQEGCRQILEGHIRVKMFGVGRIVEGIVKDSLENTYKKLPEIVRRWQMFREEALREGDGRKLLLGRPPVGCEVQWIRQEVLEVLKEPLCEEGRESPVSALCPDVVGASEASEESPARRARSQQQQQEPAANEQQQTAAALEQAAAAATPQDLGAAVGPGQQATQAAVPLQHNDEAAVAPAPAAEEGLLDLPPRSASLSISAQSVYYDAAERLDDGEVSSSHERQQAGAPLPAAEPAAAAAPAAPAGTLPRLSSAAAAVAAAVLARGAHHRRAVSGDSMTSTETPTEEGHSARQPGSHRFWRRFNRDYGEWEAVWDEVGVEQEDVEGQPAGTGGVVSRALHSLEELLKNSYYSTSILVALFMLRHGWLRVEPSTNPDPHDESIRSHTGHRHSRHSSALDGSNHTSAAPAGAGVPAPARAQSLSRVAQEVKSRMVSGSRAVAKAPVRAVTAAGSGLAAAGLTVRQASMTGAKAIFSGGRPSRTATSSSGGGAGSAGEESEDPADLLPAGRVLPGAAAAVAVGGAGGSGGNSRERGTLHLKTMSLDTGTAAAARQAAAAALQQQQHQKGGKRAVAAALGKHDAQGLQRRPSDVAAMAAMNSMQRVEHRVRAPSRLSCFTLCRRPPAVKD